MARLRSCNPAFLPWLQNVWFLFGVFQAPLHMVVVLVYAYYQMGPAVFTALVIAAVMLPFQAGVAKLVAHFRSV